MKAHHPLCYISSELHLFQAAKCPHLCPPGCCRIYVKGGWGGGGGGFLFCHSFPGTTAGDWCLPSSIIQKSVTLTGYENVRRARFWSRLQTALSFFTFLHLQDHREKPLTWQNICRFSSLTEKRRWFSTQIQWRKKKALTKQWNVV